MILKLQLFFNCFLEVDLEVYTNFTPKSILNCTPDNRAVCNIETTSLDSQQRHNRVL